MLRRRQPGALRRPPPVGQRRGRRRRRILRIERQQHDPIRRERPHLPRHGLAHRMPVAHADEHPRALVPALQPGLQCLGLPAGIGQQRRSATDLRVDVTRHRRPPSRDQPRQQPTRRPGQADDRLVVEQVEQERLDRRQGVRPAQVEQHHRRLPVARRDHSRRNSRTRSATRDTCSGGVSGSTPCPRLKTKGPSPRPRSSRSVARSRPGPPTFSR